MKKNLVILSANILLCTVVVVTKLLLCYFCWLYNLILSLLTINLSRRVVFFGIFILFSWTNLSVLKYNGKYSMVYVNRYNLGNSNVNDDNFDKLDRSVVPDVFLVKKFYGEKAARRRARNWKLKHMADELHDGISSTNE